MEIPYSGRAIINDNFGEIEIIIPTKKIWYLTIFLCLWMCGWVIGESVAIRTLLFEPPQNDNFANLFILVWLIGWTIGGFIAIRTLLWNLIGREIITLSHGQIKLNKKGAVFYRPKTYDLNEAKEFRVQDDGSNDTFNFGTQKRSNPFKLNMGGMIRFDYGMETIQFAAAIDEAEAKFILAKLIDKKYLSSKNI